MNHGGQIDIRHLYHLAGLCHTGQSGYVLQQVRQPVALRKATLQKLLKHIRRKPRIMQNRFQITLNTAHGSLQLVGNILCNLLLHAGLFLLFRNVRNGNLKAVIHKKSHRQVEHITVFVHDQQLLPKVSLRKTLARHRYKIK